MSDLYDVLIPIGVCVILPVVIVWLVSRTKQNETNRKAEIMLKAIEAGAPIDTNLLSTKSGSKSIKERLLGKLTGACVTSFIGFFLIFVGCCYSNAHGWDLSESPSPLMVIAGGILFCVGIALFIAFFSGKKMLAREIEAEEKQLNKE